MALTCVAARGQVAVISGQAINQYGQPLPNAQVRVCSVTSTGVPCTPTASIFLDFGLTIPAANPYTSDQYGNYTVYAGALAAPNLYAVQLSPASGITWSYVVNGPYCSVSGCTFTGPITAPYFNATSFPYYEVNGVQVSSSVLSDVANLAKLNVANNFTGSPQTAPIFNATTQYNVAGVQIACTNLLDCSNLAKLNASNTFAVGGISTTIGSSGISTNGNVLLTGGGSLVSSNTVNAIAQYQINGNTGTSGQCLASGGVGADTWINCLTSVTSFYQTMAANGSAQTQRPTLNFSTSFALVDSSSPAETTVNLATTGVSAGSCSFCTLTYNAMGQLTAASSGTPIVVQSLIITSGICTAAGSSYSTCTDGVVNWPTPFADNNYSVVCSGHGSSNGSGPSGSISGDIWDIARSGTGTGITITLQTVTSSGFSYGEIDCIGKHS